jgi:hypothetical protein
MIPEVTPKYDDLRKALCNFCARNQCHDCVLHIPEFRCGRGTHFERKWGERNMTDDQILDAYEIAIGAHKKANPRHKIEDKDLEPLSDDDLSIMLGGAV